MNTYKIAKLGWVPTGDGVGRVDFRGYVKRRNSNDRRFYSQCAAELAALCYRLKDTSCHYRAEQVR